MTLSVAFLGIVNVPIKTYTQSYVTLGSGWDFEGTNIEPLEYAGRGHFGTSTTFDGAKINVFSRANITPFSVGNVAGAVNNTYGECLWRNNQLIVVGQIPNATAQSEPWGVSFAAPLDGVGFTVPSPVLTKLKSLPNLSNTGTPSPSIGWGGAANAPLVLTPIPSGNITGIRIGTVTNGTNEYTIWDGVNLAQGLSDPGFGPTAGTNFNCCIPLPNGQNGCYLQSGNSTEAAPMWVQSYLMGADVWQSATFQPPASSTRNFDTWLHQNIHKGGFRPTSLGFLQFNTDTITVNGVTLAGYGLLILPNFAGYYLLNISGTDTPSDGWVPSSGGVSGAIGVSGDLFLKQSNNQTTLFISTAPVVLPAVAPDISVLRQRAWTYTLDGHTFYVLDLGAEGTYAYDITTQQWAQFKTKGLTQWDVGNGVMWGNRVVGGDLMTGDVYEVAASTTTDNGTDIEHIVTGGLATRSRVYHSVEDVRLAVSKGQYDDLAGSVMNLRFSDDGAQTWSPYYPVTLTEGKTQGSLSWRSLGSFQAPGRVFEFSDIGGPLRIDGADVFVDNFDDDNPLDQPPGQKG